LPRRSQRAHPGHERATACAPGEITERRLAKNSYTASCAMPLPTSASTAACPTPPMPRFDLDREEIFPSHQKQTPTCHPRTLKIARAVRIRKGLSGLARKDIKYKKCSLWGVCNRPRPLPTTPRCRAQDAACRSTPRAAPESFAASQEIGGVGYATPIPKIASVRLTVEGLPPDLLGGYPRELVRLSVN
jgi:hypothetical protein